MGRFPFFEESQRLNSGSPTSIAGTEDARIRGNSMQEFGSAVEKIGGMLAVEEADKATNEAKLAAEKSMLEARGSAKPDGSNVEEVFNKIYSKKEAEIRAKLDPLALAHAHGPLRQINTAAAIEAAQTKVSMQIGALKLAGEENNKIMAGNVIADPSLAATYMDEINVKYDKMDADGNPKYITNELRFKARDAVAAGYIQGMLTKGMANPSFLLKLKKELGAIGDAESVTIPASSLHTVGLSGTKDVTINYEYKNGGQVSDSMAKVLQNMRPEMRYSALNKIDQALKAHTQTKLSLINKTIEANLQMVANGEIRSQEAKDDLRQKIAAAPPEMADAYRAKADNIDSLETIAKESIDNGFYSANSMLDQLKAKEGDMPLVRQAKEEFVKKAKDILTKIEESKSDDPKTFALRYAGPEYGLKEAAAAAADGSPEAVQNLNTKLEIYQRDKRLPISFIGRDEGKSIGTQLKSSWTLGSESINQTVKQLKDRYGDDLPKVMADVVRFNKGDMPENVLLLGVFTDPEAQQAVADNLANYSKIEERFKLSENNFKDLNEVIKGQQQEFAEKFFGNPAQLNNPAILALNKEVKVEAMKLMAAGEDGNDAVKEASKSVIQKNYNFFPVGKTNIPVPKDNRYVPSVINKFLQDNNPSRVPMEDPYKDDPTGYNVNYITKGKWENRIIPEWGIENLRGIDPKNISPVQLEDFRNRAKIVMTEDQAGVQLVIEQNGKLVPAVDKNGNLMIKSYLDASRYDQTSGATLPPVKVEKPLKKIKVAPNVNTKEYSAPDSEYAPDDYYDNLPATEEDDGATGDYYE